jgi:hypothetical protein
VSSGRARICGPCGVIAPRETSDQRPWYVPFASTFSRLCVNIRETACPKQQPGLTCACLGLGSWGCGHAVDLRNETGDGPGSVGRFSPISSQESLLTSTVDQCADGAREARQYGIVCCGRACSACFVLTGASAFQRPHVTQQAVSSGTEMSSSRIGIIQDTPWCLCKALSIRRPGSTACREHQRLASSGSRIRTRSLQVEATVTASWVRCLRVSLDRGCSDSGSIQIDMFSAQRNFQRRTAC